MSARDVVASFGRREGARALVINCCNVHSVISARRDPVLYAALHAGDINTPDGMPLVWILRSEGHQDQRRITGRDVAQLAFAYGLERGWRHFFYGSTPQTLARLSQTIADRYPGIEIAGTYSPPYRPLTPPEREEVVRTITAARPDIIWVGLGMPKQEKWMHEMRDRFPGMALVGIGAAFDFLAGTMPHAPTWMQDVGLEWLYRLAREPRRLWRRYILNNPAFLLLWIRDLARR